MKVYAIQLEALRRPRNGTSQTFRIEQVHIHEGAKAVVGAVFSEPKT